MLLKRILNCARCNETHENVEAKELTRPVYYDDRDDVMYTHWASCPTNGEPILVIELETRLPSSEMSTMPF